MMYKAAVIGCGMIAGAYEELNTPSIYSHGKAYYRHQEISEIAFVDRYTERSRLLAKKFQGQAFENLAQLLSVFQPDCISVCTPDDTHFSTLKAIFEAKGQTALIFAEKPICQSRRELQELMRMEQATGIRVIVHHNRRFDLPHQKLKTLIQSNELGNLLRGTIDYYGGWCHLGVHVVDVLQYFFEESLIPKTLEYACESKYPQDPTLHVEATIEGRPLKWTGMDEAYYQLVDLDLKFEKGQIRIEDFGQNIRVFRKIVNQEKENVLELDPQQSGRGMLSPIKNAVERIVAYLKQKDSDILEPFGLIEAEKTMNTLWKGVSLYENQSSQSGPCD
ncbi:Gfo/Idh/MocA family oxidoreductase [Deltaproteobacteria bacterium TL4]